MKRWARILLVVCVIAGCTIARQIFSNSSLVTPCNQERLVALGVTAFDSKAWKVSRPRFPVKMFRDAALRVLEERWTVPQTIENLGEPNEYVDDGILVYRVADSELALEILPADRGGPQVSVWPRVPGWSLRANLWPGRCLW